MRVLFILAALLSFSANAANDQGLGIAAVVNDEVISSVDAEDRLRFVMATTKLSDTPETRARVMQQIIRQLIDEKLQLQEAVRQGITVSDKDVADAVAALEEQQGKKPGLLIGQLERWGVPKQTFLEQLRAQLAWSKLIAKKLRPQVKVTDEEIELARIQPASGQGGSEVLVNVLSLPVDKPENEKEVRALAEKLVREIQEGADFSEVARNLSLSAKTSPMWVPLNAFDPALAKALTTAQPGAVSSPVRTQDGYTIIKLLERRATAHTIAGDSELNIKNILLTLKPDDTTAEAELLLTIGREVARHPGSCTEETVAGIDDPDTVAIEVEFIRTRLSALSEKMREMVGPLSVGGVSEPFATDEGIRLLMLCERVDTPSGLADKDETYGRLMQQKLEMEARKLMRNLRREAFIEVRA